MKYFLLGGFSSGILLYGMSLLFGVAGSTNLGAIAPQVAKAVAAAPDMAGAGVRPTILLAMIALAAGLFFKIAAVPFHMWAPDAYQGAPTSVTAFLSTGSKAASFALYARIFVEALGGMRVDWAPLLGIVAAITIMVGNWAAVTQSNSKRLLAYSSVSNAGYLLLGVIIQRGAAEGKSWYYWLAGWAAFNTVVSFYYYVRFIRAMYIGDRVADERPLSLSPALQAALVVCAVFVILIGVYPLPFIK